jgi:hypothetical protein
MKEIEREIQQGKKKKNSSIHSLFPFHNLNILVIVTLHLGSISSSVQLRVIMSSPSLLS